MLFEWNNVKTFLKRGGLIWDTQYAEYLLSGQQHEFFMNSLNQLSMIYGGEQKIDLVKTMWESGVLTADIPKDLLIDYLVGEDRTGGDIGNTEIVFLQQLKKARSLGMMNTIMVRMESLLCTTEMEYNGLYIDYGEGLRKTRELTQELKDLEVFMNTHLPPFPEGMEFNWSSRNHLSCLLFGGTVKYRKQEQIIKDGNPLFKVIKERYQDGVFVSGKKKGDPKYRIREIITDEPRLIWKEYFYQFPKLVDPVGDPLTLTDAIGGPLYSVSSDIIETLDPGNIPIVEALIRRALIAKDLGTYYLSEDGKGMLTCVQPSGKIHHSLNHVQTVTTRLSSSNPNLQNIPRSGTSEARKLFVSRFGKDGCMLEADYSQLEIIGQAWLSGDENLREDIVNGIDMHCRRVSIKYGIDYNDAVYLCKNESATDHKLWHSRRTDAKAFSFQRAFGAGANSISESIGIPVEEVKELIQAEEAMYPTLVKYNTKVSDDVLSSALPFRDPSRDNKVYRKGQYISPTGARFTFRTYDAPEFLVKRGTLESFKPTEMKNYPVQGTSAEFVQIALGRLFRHFLRNDNYNSRAFLCNTVHDCVWIDTMNSMRQRVARDIKNIMEGIPGYIKEVYNLECNVPFKVEVEYGDNLYSMHPVKEI